MTANQIWFKFNLQLLKIEDQILQVRDLQVNFQIWFKVENQVYEQVLEQIVAHQISVQINRLVSP